VLNPFTYSLRNRDMKEALRILIHRIACLLWLIISFGIRFLD
jgi:hypothetical protein